MIKLIDDVCPSFQRVVFDRQIRFYLSQWYRISHEDVDRSIDESNIDQTKYNEKLMYRSSPVCGH
jgi:hypothetical protein